jgi:hypothetical protein
MASTCSSAASDTAAIATFEQLGLRAEALLSDFVIDREGRTRDLMITVDQANTPSTAPRTRTPLPHPCGRVPRALSHE